MGRMVGIDLGTTNCCVAWTENGKVTILPMPDGGYTMPSVVAFQQDGPTLIGEAAKRQAVVEPARTVYGAKRLIGRKFKDQKIQRWAKGVGYEITEGKQGDAWIRVAGETYSPEAISAMLLGELKTRAERYLGETVESAIVTVPAYFNERQRQATKDAGVIAGLHVEHILNEPTAAALGYGVAKGQNERLAVFDLGGGTFDITILEQRGDLFEVRATHGDTFLGGEDFDQQMVDYLVEAFKKRTHFDLRLEPVAMQRLRDAAEATKHALSATDSVPINLPFLIESAGSPMHLNVEAFGRKDLDTLNLQVLKRLEKPCFAALESAGLLPSEIDRVLLAGGMTRMRAVQQKVEEIFHKRAQHHMDPDHIVAIGAAVQCGILQGDLGAVTLLDVTPHSLGLRVADGRHRDRMRVLIPKNTTIPISEERSFTTTADLQRSVRIEVYQGESDDVTENVCLGQFFLGNLPELQAGDMEIRVTFLIDADGLLQVAAQEVSTGQEASIAIKSFSGLSPEEVDQLRIAAGTAPAEA
ncbi:MAG: Hsp70 family protein [Myxococcales bacterium]|nr:Hsp70 family protein [Myxococcales bacterium]